MISEEVARTGLSVVVGIEFRPLDPRDLKELLERRLVETAWLEARRPDRAGRLMCPVRHLRKVWLARHDDNSIGVYDLKELDGRSTATLRSWSREAALEAKESKQQKAKEDAPAPKRMIQF